MAREVRVPITPSVLRWAMTESGYDPVALGERLKVPADVVNRWLQGVEKPLLGEFRNVAHVLRRPTATFLLPAPPATQQPPVAFRQPPGERDRALQTSERHRMREVARLQRLVGSLLEQLEEQPFSLPRLKSSGEPEVAGERLRDLLGVPLTAQLAWSGDAEAVSSWREALEKMGVLVFLLPMGKDAARGFSIYDDYAPAIAVNTHWNQAARTFTLLHELAHLLTRTNSICSEVLSSSPAASEDVERWCERAAAAALMPTSAIGSILASWGNPTPTLDIAKKLARRFRVSLNAAALRLITLGHAEWELYASVPIGSDAKTGGGGGTGRKRAKIRLDEYGRRTTSLVLRCVQRDVISPAEAMNYLDVSFGDLDQLAALL